MEGDYSLALPLIRHEIVKQGPIGHYRYKVEKKLEVRLPTISFLQEFLYILSKWNAFSHYQEISQTRDSVLSSPSATLKGTEKVRWM